MKAEAMALTLRTMTDSRGEIAAGEVLHPFGYDLDEPGLFGHPVTSLKTSSIRRAGVAKRVSGLVIYWKQVQWTGGTELPTSLALGPILEQLRH